MSDKKPVLELRNVDKSFGPIDVLHEISLKVGEGEVLCLLGDNGAGKSTLIKTLAGVHQPTRGEILMDGTPTSFSSPRDAQERGIATVHQFGGTYPLMSVGHNFFMGMEPTKGVGPFKVYDREKANRIAVEEVQKMGITRITDGDRLVGGLSGGERQSLAIARAVYFGARVLILDEPTAALGVKQAPRAAHRERGQAARSRGDLHHPPGDARHGGGRSLRRPDPRRDCRRFPQGRQDTRGDRRSDGRRREHGGSGSQYRRVHGDPRRPPAAARGLRRRGGPHRPPHEHPHFT